MSRILPILIVFLFTSFIVFSQKTNEPYLEGKVIFKIKPENKSIIKGNKVLDAEMSAILEEAGVESIQRKFPNTKVPNKKTDKYGRPYSDLTTIFEVEISSDKDIFILIQSLKMQEEIEYAHPHYLPKLLYVPDDPLNESNQWYLGLIKAYDAFDICAGDTNVMIGITDTGTDIDHEDLVYNIAYNNNDPLDGIDNDYDGFIDNFRGWDLAENDNNPQADSASHGTWVSGLCAPTTDNGIGLTGSAFKCRFLPIKISNDYNQLTMAYEGIVYAANHNCKVINCSWGSTSFTEMGEDIINYAVVNCDALVVAACGNENNNSLYYPASYEYVLSVAATTELDEKWSPENTATSGGSSYNYMVDISAPGAMVYTTGDGDFTMGWGGTSFAAPIVSGAAALIRSYYPEMTALQILELLKISTDLIDTIPFNQEFAGFLGTGRLNMHKALTMDLTPSLVFTQITITDDRDSNYENSDVVEVGGVFVNYLDTAYNAIVNISCDNQNIELLTSEVQMGTLNPLQAYETNDSPIMFRILDGIGFNTTIELKLEYTADDYAGSQYIEVFIKPGFKDIDANNILLSVAGNGRLGYYDSQNNIGNGMRYNNGEPLFYDSGLIAGTSLDTIFSSVRQNSDFFTVNYPLKSESNGISDMEVFAKFDDRNDANNLGVEVDMYAWEWEDSDYENFVMINYEFINTSEADITNFYAGIFSDWDISDYSLNKIDYDQVNKFLYAWYTGNQSMYVGMQLLSGQNECHYAVDNIIGGDGVIDLSNGFSDSEKFYVISNNRNQAGISGDGNDIVGVVSAGPIDIAVGDTVVVSFALHACTNLYSLKNSIQNADYLYNQVLHPSSLAELNLGHISIYPNPTSDGFTINIPSSLMGEQVVLSICNSLGEDVYKKEMKITNNSIKLNADYQSGMYFLTIDTGKLKYKTKIVIKP